MDEIEEYAMFITRSHSDDHAVSYRIHNLQSVYDASYYANAIDVHIDDHVEIALNTLQLNALLALLNHILGDEGSSVASGTEALPGDKSPVETVMVGEGEWRQSTQSQQSQQSTQSQQSQQSTQSQQQTQTQAKPGPLTIPSSSAERKAITKKFDVNSIALSVGSVSFAYYLPLHLLPSSYQRGGNVPYLGEEKQQERAATQWDLPKYAVESLCLSD